MVERIRLVGLPGSGKTTRLLHEIRHFITQDDYQVGDIIFCSHSNASVNEARERVEAQFGYKRIEFTTMHSLAKKLVTRHRGENYISIVDVTEDYHLQDQGLENPVIELLRTLERKYNRMDRWDDKENYQSKLESEFTSYFRIKSLPHSSDTARSFSSIIVNEMHIPAKVEELSYHDSFDPRVGGVFNDLKHDLFVGLYNLIQIVETAWAVQVIPENRVKVENILQKVVKKRSNVSARALSNLLFSIQKAVKVFRNGSYSFNQVLFETLEHQLTPRGKILIIDEYQDIGKLQFELSELWAEKMDIFMVAGDPNQSIFGFNGVSPDFLENFPFDREISLLESYRVPDRVVEYARSVYPNHWTQQMKSKSGREGTCQLFDIRETIDYLYQNSDRKTYILGRSDDIIKLVQQEFFRFGIIPKGKDLSFDLRKVLRGLSIYQDLLGELETQTPAKNTLQNFLDQIDRYEKEFGDSFSEHFDQNQISSWLQQQESTMNGKLSWKEVERFNLLNLEQEVNVPESDEITNQLIRTTLLDLLPYQRKRLRRMIDRLLKGINTKSANLQDLDKFQTEFEKYNYKVDPDLSILLRTEKIEQWKYNIRYRNFMNKLRYSHLEKFGLINIYNAIKEIDAIETDSSTTAYPSIDEIDSVLLERYRPIIKNLNGIERQILEYYVNSDIDFNKMQELQQNVKFLTMHAAKGRESDIVVIPSIRTYYEEKKLTDPEESKRVYFVAATRTKSDLIIIEDNLFPKKPSKYLPTPSN